MAISIKNELLILDEDFRKGVIEEIEGEENQTRKGEAKRRYEIYRDQTKKYVKEAIKRDLMGGNAEVNQQVYATIQEMCQRAANISILKKIISKKAILYKKEVKREVYDYDGNLLEDETEKVTNVYREINANASFKKVNRINEYQKNGTLMVRPFEDTVTGKYCYQLRSLQPYSYDVIENKENLEDAIVYVLSTYKRRSVAQSSSYSEASRHGVGRMDFASGDGTDQKIADSMSDEESSDTNYIWWSRNYHFTTDDKGRVITEESNNDFGILNFYDFATDKDGHFWAIGGDDLVDGSILINLLLTDLYYIQKYQGFGFFYAFAPDMPEEISVGPRKGITGRIKEGDPSPVVGFANPNSPLTDHMKIIEQYLAFLLSTNNLEPGNISGQLSGANAHSGIQEIIRKSEPTDDVQDIEQFYRNGEMHIFEAIKRVHNSYYERNLLIPELARIGAFRLDTRLSIRYSQPQVYSSEKEKVEIMKMRKELGIDSMIDTIMKDNPSLTVEEAKAKLKGLLEEKLKESQAKLRRAFGIIPQEDDREEDDREEDGEDNEE